MYVTENQRLSLRQKFEEFLGPELAAITMDLMPPIDYDKIATKEHLDLQGRELRAGTATLGGELQTEMAEVRTEMAELRGDMVAGFAKLEGQIELAMATQLRQTLLIMIGLVISVAGLVACFG